MSDLAMFLELVHTAGSRWRTLNATGELTMDPGAAMEGLQKMFGSMGTPMPPVSVAGFPQCCGVCVGVIPQLGVGVIPQFWVDDERYLRVFVGGSLTY